MKKDVLKIVFAVLVFCIGGWGGRADAALITIGIEATVNYVNDYHNLLEGNVIVGSTITGTYTYDPSTPDTNPASNRGDYVYYSSPCGLILTINGITFMSNPNNTMFKLGVMDNNPGEMRDSYGIRSPKF